MLKTAALSLSLFVFSSFNTAFACPEATPTNTATFCETFKTAAQCHCTASGLPNRMCIDMHSLYDRMLIIFHSVQKACEFQKDTAPQNCMDAWNCYRNGGLNSQNELCSGTGAACA